MDITQIHKGLVKKEFSCVEITNNYLEKIKKSKLNAFICVTEEIAIENAIKTDANIAAGKRIGILDGIPMSLKDNISSRGIKTTCGSKMLENYEPIYDATAWELLKKNGVVLLGKNNQDEFAMGSSNESSYYGPVKNPHDLTKVPGGSSGGGAASVAGGLAVFAIGSDTGGSIRQPAAFCGTVGLKPSYGSVSRYGLIPLASSFDVIGPLTQNVRDAAIVFDAISVHDPKDSTSSRHRREKTAEHLEDDIIGIRISMPKNCLNDIDNSVASAIEESARIYERLGAKITYFDLPYLDYVMSIYYILQCAEVSSNLGRYDGIRFGYRPKEFDDTNDLMIKSRSEGFGAEVKRRILLGTYVLSSGFYDSYYKKAQKLREKLTNSIEEILSSIDLILMPTAPTTAFGFEHNAAPQEMYFADIFTVIANEIRAPAISIPCGKDKNGLPIGMQLMSLRFHEAKLLNVAHQFEQFSEKKFNIS